MGRRPIARRGVFCYSVFRNRCPLVNQRMGVFRMYCIKVEEGQERIAVRQYKTGFIPLYTPALIMPVNASEKRKAPVLNTKGVKRPVVPGYVFMISKDPRAQRVDDGEWKIIEAISDSRPSFRNPGTEKITDGPLTKLNPLIIKAYEDRVQIRTRLLGRDRKYWLKVNLASAVKMDEPEDTAEKAKADGKPEGNGKKASTKQPAERGRCRDHLGNEYPTMKAMAEAYGLPYSTVAGRRSMGWDWESTLTAPLMRHTDLTDHLGNIYPSLEAMAKAYGIAPTTLLYRLDHHWSIEKALTGTERETVKRKCRDHLGNEYQSQKEMLKAYGINHDVYKYRIKQGWGLEKTLTTPVAPHDHSCTDHLGNEYPSKSAMAKAYGITYPILKSRLKYGYSLEEALTMPVDKRKTGRRKKKGKLTEKQIKAK